MNAPPLDAEPASAAGLPADAVLVGRVREAWGIAGWIRVEPFNDPDDSVLLTARRWWLRSPEPAEGMPRSVKPGPSRGPTSPVCLKISRCRVHSDALVAKPVGVDDRSAAESLKGLEILVSREAFPRPAEGEFYWVDLIGCELRNSSGVVLGLVSQIDHHGAHPILVVRDGEHERLVPFVDALIQQVDLPARLIVAEWEPDW